ncbi:MAG: hypothetical protein H7Y33_17040 [Cytophagales bacterium]|nr:hypothetical protein [Rhizobacter sp.]
MTDPSPTFELRVLAGPQLGASIALKRDAEVSIGSSDAARCEIVLRDPLIHAHRIRLRLMGERARIKIVDGQVDIAGRVLTGPCHTDWSLFTPLRMGDTVIAIGQAGSERWADVLTPQRALVLQGDEAQAELPKPRRLQPEAWVATIGGAVAVGVAVLLGVVTVTSSANHIPGEDRQRLNQLLARAEFGGLQIEAGHNGGTLVRGALPSRSVRAQLDNALSAARLSPLLDVRVTEDLASSVGEVFRMHGVAATVEPIASQPGAFAVRTAEHNLGKLKTAENAVRRDVPGLAAMNVENTPVRAAPSSSGAPYDPRKRVAAVVAGDVPYVVTMDGARYFVGAMLPSGHRVESITGQQVLLSKDGMASPLRF